MKLWIFRIPSASEITLCLAGLAVSRWIIQMVVDILFGASLGQHAGGDMSLVLIDLSMMFLILQLVSPSIPRIAAYAAAATAGTIAVSVMTAFFATIQLTHLWEVLLGWILIATVEAFVLVSIGRPE
jgi:hypothetical protein